MYCMISVYQFFFPRMKKELPSGIGTIFSLGPENSGFNGATPAIKKGEYKTGVSTSGVSLLQDVMPITLTFQSLDGPQFLVLLPIILFVLHMRHKISCCYFGNSHLIFV